MAQFSFWLSEQHHGGHKNEHLMKGKKGAKKKVVDPFSKNDGYDLKASAMFSIRNIGKTL